MAQGPVTENEKLRRRLKWTARNKVHAILREKYREEFDGYLAKHRAEIQKRDSHGNYYNRANGDMRAAHREEFTMLMVLVETKLQDEHGYESRTHVGRAQRWA